MTGSGSNAIGISSCDIKVFVEETGLWIQTNEIYS